MAPVTDLDIDLDDDPIIPPSRFNKKGKYSEYSWIFRTNEKNPKIIVFKKQGETDGTELDWIIVPLDEERTLWTFKTIHYWDYAANEYDFYYESDTCERYLIETFLKSEDFDKPFNGEQITYNDVTYNLIVDKYHDCISNIIYPDNTQYNIVDNSAVHLTGADDIYGKKTFNDITKLKNSLQLQSTEIEKGTNPDSAKYQILAFYDKYGTDQKNKTGQIYTTRTQGMLSVSMDVFQPISNTTNSEGIKVYYPESGNPYTYAPTPIDTTTTSGTQIATTGWVNSANNNVVHKTDSETIAGEKTFTSNVTIKKNIPKINYEDSNAIKGTAPSSTSHEDVNFNDKDGNQLTGIVGYYKTNKETQLELRAYKANSSTDGTYGVLSIVHPASDNPYATAPTPSSISDYSNKIATTQWVKNSIRGKNLANNLSTKTGVITLNESIQNFPILIFGVGPVGSYQYSTCVVTPFVGARLNSYRDFSWQINGDTIRLNYTNGQTSATSQMITLKITSNVSVEIVTNTGNIEIRGVFGLSFN